MLYYEKSSSPLTHILSTHEFSYFHQEKKIAMHTETVTYYDADQRLTGQYFNPFPQQTGQPAVILFSAFEGISPFSVGYAKKLAAEGYIVFLADIYGEGRCASTLDECFQFIQPFLADRALVRRRANLALKACQAIPGIDSSRIGALGFCFGGMCLLELARSGAPLRAGVTLHGVLAPSHLPTLPIHTALLILQGYADPQVPPTAISIFAEEMKAADTSDWSMVLFGLAQHSFTDPATGTYDPVREAEMGRVYDPLAAQRSYQYTVVFLKEQLQ